MTENFKAKLNYIPFLIPTPVLYAGESEVFLIAFRLGGIAAKI
jgi:hypothetical protein